MSDAPKSTLDPLKVFGGLIVLVLIIWAVVYAIRHQAPTSAPKATATAYPAHVKTWVTFELTSASPSPAAYAPYVNYALVNAGGANGASIIAAGIGVIPYTDPSHWVTPPNTHLNNLFDSTDVALTCGRQQVVWAKPGHGLIYLTDIRDADVAAKWKLTAQWLTGQIGAYTAIFEDTADGPYAYASPAPPCDPVTHQVVTQDAWTKAEFAMETALGFPVVFNGLGASGNGVSPHNAMLGGPALGGMDEGCDDNYNAAPYAISLGAKWLAHRAAQLAALANHKWFVCHHLQGTDGAAATAITVRLYHYASFLLTYDYATDIYSDEWGVGASSRCTPTNAVPCGSNVRVQPETAFVPLNPLVPTPTNISALLGKDGAYHREYADCILKKVDQGKCDVVVNPAQPTNKNPGTVTLIEPFTPTRSLKLAGAGVLDGGTATVGAGAPRTLASGTGAVVFP